MLVAAPSGLPCKGCKRTESSTWRGKDRRFCAGYGCKKKAKEERLAAKRDEKDARIDELEDLVDAQAEELSDLKERVRVIEKLLKAQLAVADAPRAGQRRPLGALPLNAQPQPQAAALALKPPAKKPRAVEAAPKLPR